MIDQGHVFFHSKPIPPGTYEVVVTAAGGISANASFLVYRYNSQPALAGGAAGPAADGPATGRAAGRRRP